MMSRKGITPQTQASSSFGNNTTSNNLQSQHQYGVEITSFVVETFVSSMRRSHHSSDDLIDEFTTHESDIISSQNQSFILLADLPISLSLRLQNSQKKKRSRIRFLAPPRLSIVLRPRMPRQTAVQFPVVGNQWELAQQSYPAAAFASNSNHAAHHVHTPESYGRRLLVSQVPNVCVTLMRLLPSILRTLRPLALPTLLPTDSHISTPESKSRFYRVRPQLKT